jgi:hypothetical protein
MYAAGLDFETKQNHLSQEGKHKAQVRAGRETKKAEGGKERVQKTDLAGDICDVNAARTVIDCLVYCLFIVDSI